MYAHLHRRFQVTVNDCIELLEAMAPKRSRPDPIRAAIPSSASSPSLRSKEMVVVPMNSPAPMNPGGNVKVVVRVRGFLQRGNFLLLIRR
jgi:hypothetical protein